MVLKKSNLICEYKTIMVLQLWHMFRVTSSDGNQHLFHWNFITFKTGFFPPFHYAKLHFFTVTQKFCKTFGLTNFWNGILPKAKCRVQSYTRDVWPQWLEPGSLTFTVCFKCALGQGTNLSIGIVNGLI